MSLAEDHKCTPSEWSVAHDCAYRTCARCGRVVNVEVNPNVVVAVLAAEGIKRRPLASGESYASGLPPAKWPTMTSNRASATDLEG